MWQYSGSINNALRAKNSFHSSTVQPLPLVVWKNHIESENFVGFSAVPTSRIWKDWSIFNLLVRVHGFVRLKVDDVYAWQFDIYHTQAPDKLMDHPIRNERGDSLHELFQCCAIHPA